MNDPKNMEYGWRERWNDFRPTKKATLGLMVASVIIVTWTAFGTGAWMTASKAEELARLEAREARTELAGAWCVDRFLATQDATTRLGEIQGLRSRLQRTRYIETGDWSVLPGESSPSRQVAQRCGDMLAEIEFSTMSEEGQATEEL